MESKKSDLGFLFSMFEKINLFKYGAFIGVLLLAIEFAWVWKESKNKLQA